MDDMATRFGDDLIALKRAHLCASGRIGKLIGAGTPIASYGSAVRTVSHPRGGVPIVCVGRVPRRISASAMERPRGAPIPVCINSIRTQLRRRHLSGLDARKDLR